MTDKVERFSIGPNPERQKFSGAYKTANGEMVRYSDYKKLENELDQIQAEYFEQKQLRKDWANRADKAEAQRDKALANLEELISIARSVFARADVYQAAASLTRKRIAELKEKK